MINHALTVYLSLTKEFQYYDQPCYNRISFVDQGVSILLPVAKPVLLSINNLILGMNWVHLSGCSLIF